MKTHRYTLVLDDAQHDHIQSKVASLHHTASGYIRMLIGNDMAGNTPAKVATTASVKTPVTKPSPPANNKLPDFDVDSINFED